jgi:C4-dicarboxylate-specific signal transduction histidine kinase
LADAGQLQQLFLNMVLNAETEMTRAHGKGNLLVKTERMDNAIRIPSKDDGPGIPKRNLDNVFEPFSTTRLVGEGTGLGLSAEPDKESGGRILGEGHELETTHNGDDALQQLHSED